MSFLLLTSSLWAAPPSAAIVSAPGFSCTSGHRTGEGFEMTTVRCTHNSGITVEAMHFVAVKANAPTAEDTCKSDQRRRYSMTFERIDEAVPVLVTLGKRPACRVDVLGTYGNTGGPWKLTDVTVPLEDKHWLTLVAQGPAESMKAQQAAVERFLLETGVK